MNKYIKKTQTNVRTCHMDSPLEINVLYKVLRHKLFNFLWDYFQLVDF